MPIYPNSTGDLIETARLFVTTGYMSDSEEQSERNCLLSGKAQSTYKELFTSAG